MLFSIEMHWNQKEIGCQRPRMAARVIETKGQFDFCISMVNRNVAKITHHFTIFINTKSLFTLSWRIKQLPFQSGSFQGIIN